MLEQRKLLIGLGMRRPEKREFIEVFKVSVVSGEILVDRRAEGWGSHWKKWKKEMAPEWKKS